MNDYTGHQTTLTVPAGGYVSHDPSHVRFEQVTTVRDLAVGSGVGQIKAGAPAREERVLKYNRLAAIEASNPNLPYGLR